MKKEIIRTDKVAKPVGPYSLAVKAKGGTLLFVAGTVGLDREGKVVKGGIAVQCRQAFENLKAILEAAGGTLDNVVSFTNYLVSIKDYPVIAEIRKEYLKNTENYPASTVVQVKSLVSKDLLLEIEAIAVLDE